jgi:glycosyltransferase involved in cell wall biosynthesis
MRGAVYHFADRARSADLPRFDLVLASDYLNVAEWRALAPPGLASVPVTLYFHENQLTYPLGARAPEDFHYGWINLSSALASNRVLFNSRYHREEFLGAVERGLRRMPDAVPDSLMDTLRRQSEVFSLGIDFEPHRARAAAHPRPREKGSTPVLLWNHRWEYDKAPERFIEALIRLKKRGFRFRLNLCGAVPARSHPALTLAAQQLQEETLHVGFFERQEDYLDTLASSDVVVSTARHEFFGVSVAEAIYLGCLPFLPRALSYPELVPSARHDEFLYAPDAPLDRVLGAFLADPPLGRRAELRTHVETFDWSRRAAEFDGILEEVARTGR